MIEHVEGRLGLTVQGRKLLRRSGLLNDPNHVAHVTALLQEIDEVDLKLHGQTASSAPLNVEDVVRALSDEEAIEEPWRPRHTGIRSEVATYWRGMPAGSHWVPAVLPQGSDEPDEPPPHPSTQPSRLIRYSRRLFGRSRRDGT